MKNKFLIALPTLILLTIVTAAGCSSSYATSEQVAALQNQVNSLNSSLNSTQQQLTSTQQQLVSAQQSLSQAQSQLQQQKTQVTSVQPMPVYRPVYQPTIIYRTYPYVTLWYQSPLPSRPPQPLQPPRPPYPPYPPVP